MSPESEPRRGVLLFNLGGPETLDDVRPFLYNLFSDPDIIRIRSSLLRKSLAWLIAATRQSKSKNLYRQIGGGSPLRKITEGQASALEVRLAAAGLPARVYVGMRCWNPTIDAAFERIQADGIQRLVLLPLFPQYSVTTTGSCFNYFRGLLRKSGRPAPSVAYVDAWYDDNLYIQAMARTVREGLGKFTGAPPESVHILYSAHSIPVRYVEEGDPYLEQTKKTVEMIDSSLGKASPSTLAFQSKVGPVRWLEPATGAVLERMGADGIRRVLAVPVSFVSDHIETLQEIDIAYRELAAKAGITEFHRADSLNLNTDFVDALAGIAQRAF